jgi:hypothetical protein
VGGFSDLPQKSGRGIRVKRNKKEKLSRGRKSGLVEGSEKEISI